MTLGRRFTAEDSLKAGLVYSVCPPSKLLDTAKSVGESIVPPTGLKRSAVKMMKEHVYKSVIDSRLTPDEDHHGFKSLSAKL